MAENWDGLVELTDDSMEEDEDWEEGDDLNDLLGGYASTELVPGGIGSSREVLVGNMAWDLRVAGHRTVDIWAMLARRFENLSPDEVADALRAYAERRKADMIRTTVVLELDRLDVLLAACMPGVRAGDPKSISNALSICRSRRTLLGLDAPEKKSLDIGGESASPVDEAVQKLISDLDSLT